jgi:SAM-dependent methyltransferase
VSFDVPADAYASFMGRFSEPLADAFVDLLHVRHGVRALDVGCGPGALTARLVERLGPDAVAAVDPSPSFVGAVRSRLPDIDVRQSTAEQLPFADDEFDLCLAQLVVHFMAEPVAGIAQMARVTRPGGAVGACVWDHAGERGPLSHFWRAVRQLDPSAHGESRLAGAREGHLVELFTAAGLPGVVGTTLTVTTYFSTFDEWWAPYTLGVGPAGAYVASLEVTEQEELRRRCAELLPSAPFELTAAAWCATATVRP